MNVLIAIPAYNEEKNILNVINLINESLSDVDYVVINDGSSDSTLKICQENGCTVLDLPINLGLSGAFGCAMKYAWQMGYDAIVQIDGDLQHNPSYIVDMIQVMTDTNCDVVIGSRFCDKPASIKTLRGLGSRLITFLIRIRTNSIIHDPTSGMRLYNRRVVEQFVKNDFMEPEPNTLAYLIKNGYKIRETQVVMNERTFGKSYLQGYKVLKYMFRICVSILLV